MRTVQRQVDAITRSRTQGIGIDQRVGITRAAGIVDEGLGPTGPPHAGRRHHGALDVGVARNRQVLFDLGTIQGDLGDFRTQLRQALQLFLQPQAGGHEDLVIATAPGVDAAACVAKPLGEPRLDRRMAIFVLRIEHETALAEVFGQYVQLTQQAVQLVAAEDADVLQALRMRATGGDVVQEEGAVEDHVVAREEGLDLGVYRNAGLLPQKVCHVLAPSAATAAVSMRG